MKEAENSVKDTRISECKKCLVALFNHLTVLQAGATGEEKDFINKNYKIVHALRLDFLKFYSDENMNERRTEVKNSTVILEEKPPVIDESMKVILEKEKNRPTED